jgi:hypothetical protein
MDGRLKAGHDEAGGSPTLMGGLDPAPTARAGLDPLLTVRAGLDPAIHTSFLPAAPEPATASK